MKLSESYSVPDRYVKELQQYDPLLRLRWGRMEGVVRIERKISRGLSIDPATVANHDDAEGFRDGYAVVLKFPPLEHNWPLMFYTLWRSDVQRLGGAEAVSSDLESRELHEKARRAWNRRDDFRYMATELIQHMNGIRTVPEGAGHKAYGSFK